MLWFGLISDPRVVSLSSHLEVLALVELILHLLLLELVLRHYILILRYPYFALSHLLLVWKLRFDQVHLRTELSSLLQILIIPVHAGFCTIVLEH